jgi:putative FmdB family regulatory protein
MPIYAYKCSACGFAQDVLQKVSDAPLTDCPQCQAATLAKQLTAAGFQLRGSGWYATDFKNGPGKRDGTAKTSEPAGANAEAKSSESAGGNAKAKSSESAGGNAETKKPESTGGTKTEKAQSAASGGCGHGGCSACS